MRLDLPYQQYSALLNDQLNKPLSLDLLLAPFHLQLGLSRSEEASPYLLVGHLIDELAASYKPDSPIDALDVAAAAWGLGYDAAADFLEHGPYLMYQLLKAEADA